MPGYGRNNVMRKSATATSNKEVALEIPSSGENMRTFIQTVYVGLAGTGTPAVLLTIADGVILPGGSSEENEVTFPIAVLGTLVLPIEYQSGAGAKVKLKLAAQSGMTGYLTAVYYID